MQKFQEKSSTFDFLTHAPRTQVNISLKLIMHTEYQNSCPSVIVENWLKFKDDGS